jgi:hypothetical protein
MNARVTAQDVEDNVASEHYFIASDAAQGERSVHVCKEGGWLLGRMQQLTLCVLQLRNGFTVTGESICADAEQFDAAAGRAYARTKAVEKAWEVMAYERRQRLHEFNSVTDANVPGAQAGSTA